MAEVIAISDLSDPRLEPYRAIRDRDLRGPDGHRGRFIGETPLVVEKMLAMPGVTESVLVRDTLVERIHRMVNDETPVYTIPESMMQEIVGYAIHRGVLAAGRRDSFDARTPDDLLPEGEAQPCTLLLLESIGNIDNIGMLFRNAAAFAVDGVLLSPDCHDPLYRKSLRVSIGHALTLPWARSADWRDDLDRLRTEHGFTLVGTGIVAGSVPVDHVEPPARVAIIVGNEFDGVSAATSACCDHRVRIPMAPGVDSLNVAVAAAVCLHRFSRGQRV